jgi:hypothetical protein
MSAYKPQRRLARELAHEIEAARLALEHAHGTSADIDHIISLRDDLRELERQYFMTGVTEEREP